MSRKKILIVSPYFYPNVEWGGPVTVVLNQVITLKRVGYKVCVLSTDVSKYSRRISRPEVIVKGVRVFYARALIPSLAWNFRVFLSLEQLFKGWRLISDYDVVHFQDLFILNNFFLSFRCMVLGKPYLITPHGSLSLSRERGKYFLKRIFLSFFVSKFLSRASCIIAVSDKERNQICKQFPHLSSKVVFIPNLVFKDKFNKLDVRSKLGIDKDSLMLLYLGRLSEQKGVLELVEGFLTYLSIYKDDAVLVLAGPDEGVASRVNKILEDSKLKERVIFAGEVSGDLKFNLIESSDVVCLLSMTESMPTVLLEAALFSKPSICTSECNMESLVNLGGSLVTSRNSLEIAEKIRVLSDSTVRRDMGQRANRWFKDYFNIKKVESMYKQVYG